MLTCLLPKAHCFKKAKEINVTFFALCWALKPDVVLDTVEVVAVFVVEDVFSEANTVVAVDVVGLLTIVGKKMNCLTVECQNKR